MTQQESTSRLFLWGLCVGDEMTCLYAVVRCSSEVKGKEYFAGFLHHGQWRCFVFFRIGCGLDRLQWEHVSAMIEEVFEATDIKITVYTL